MHFVLLTIQNRNSLLMFNLLTNFNLRKHLLNIT